jgi:hypothetical protein
MVPIFIFAHHLTLSFLATLPDVTPLLSNTSQPAWYATIAHTIDANISIWWLPFYTTTRFATNMSAKTQKTSIFPRFRPTLSTRIKEASLSACLIIQLGDRGRSRSCRPYARLHCRRFVSRIEAQCQLERESQTWTIIQSFRFLETETVFARQR